MTKYREMRVFVASVIIVFFGLGLAWGYALATINSNSADWTVAPCSRWADTEFPQLPPYTIPNLCVAPDGSIVKAGK